MQRITRHVNTPTAELGSVRSDGDRLTAHFPSARSAREGWPIRELKADTTNGISAEPGATAGFAEQLPAAATRAAYQIERKLVQMLHSRLGHPNVSIVLWDGFAAGDADQLVGRVILRQPWVLWRLLIDCEITFGEAYASGNLEIIGDLIQTLTELNLGLARVPRKAGLSRLFQPLLGRHSSRQTLAESKTSVYHHYDIGNEFYKLWLDEQLVYTCAYYATADSSLAEAQVAKFDHVCRKLRLRPGESVVEAGCGWGGLALHMAREYGVQVKAYNLSRQQLAYARERAEREGLSGQVEFIEDDYRNIQGQFDAFVSVGMLEHVGPRNYPALGEIMQRVLTDDGRGLIHTIGRNFAAPLDAWIERHIFPGACPPSLKEMMDLFENSGFSVVDVENLRPHYARTCADWFDRLQQHAEQVEAMFGLEFLRMWRLYLAGSSAAFQSGWLQLFQVLFTRSTNNTLPWTRADWYGPGESGLANQ